MRYVVGAAIVGACLGSIACNPDVPDFQSPSLGTSTCAANTIVAPVASVPLTVLGQGAVTSRYTGEVDARGSIAYTTTWGTRTPGTPGNAIYIWNVAGNIPQLVDSVIVGNGAVTLGDVAVSDDGTLLVVATEFTGGSIMVYDISTPTAPVLRSRFTNAETDPGVHTAEIGRVNGKLYAFLSVDPRSGGSASPARLVIVDISNASAPAQVFSKTVGTPFVHDVFVRNGLLFLALWDGGMEIWDIGGAGNGSLSAPRVISSTLTVNGNAHNIWWFHDPATGAKPYAFVGEEGPSGGIGVASTGDIHVMDVCDMAKPREVAFYHVPGAGAHNFSMDEAHGILYAAFYNGGVRAIDVRGDLSACTAEQKSPDGRCNLSLMGREVATGVTDRAGRYVWGVVFRNGSLYLSDMNNGIWKLRAFGF